MPKTTVMPFDSVVVPLGAEASAVRRGWGRKPPGFVLVPAGAASADGIAGGMAGGTALVLGLCGALDPALHVGDIVVYDRIVAVDGEIALDRELARASAGALGGVPLVRAANAGHVVGSVEEKAALGRATGAVVVDMEALSLARVLSARGTRFVMVRVVSDDARGEMPKLAGIYNAGGRLRPFSLAIALLRNPARSLRFIANVRVALNALRRASASLASAV